eukprot:g933.t1
MDASHTSISSSPYMVEPEDGVTTKKQNDNEEGGNLQGIVQREGGGDDLASVHYMEFDFSPMIAADVQNLGYSKTLMLAFRMNGLIDSNGGNGNIANTLLGQFSKQFSDDCVKLLLAEDKDRDAALKQLQKRQEKIMRIMESYNESSSRLTILNLFDLGLWFVLGLAGMCYPQPDGSLSWVQILIGFLICLSCIMSFQVATDIRTPAFHSNSIEKRLNGAYHLNRVLSHFHGSHANFKAWLNGSRVCISAFGIHLDEELFSRIGAVLSTVLVAGLGVVARTLFLQS